MKPKTRELSVSIIYHKNNQHRHTFNHTGSPSSWSPYTPRKHPHLPFIMDVPREQETLSIETEIRGKQQHREGILRLYVGDRRNNRRDNN